MSKKTAIKKKSFSLDSLKKSHSSKTKYKPTSFFDIGEAFHKASGLPGPVMHNINMFLGHSNSSKTTALIGSAVSAIKQGYLPVFLITERKWAWDYCRNLGLESEYVENEDGEEVIEYLEGPHKPKKYTIEELKELKKVYQDKIKALKEG